MGAAFIERRLSLMILFIIFESVFISLFNHFACLILGVYVDTIHEKNVPKMDDTEDERAPLLRKQERLERQIISEINRVDARVDELLPHAGISISPD
jgi:hypothetical protein